MLELDEEVLIAAVQIVGAPALSEAINSALVSHLHTLPSSMRQQQQDSIEQYLRDAEAQDGPVPDDIRIAADRQFDERFERMDRVRAMRGKLDKSNVADEGQPPEIVARSVRESYAGLLTGVFGDDDAERETYVRGESEAWDESPK